MSASRHQSQGRAYLCAWIFIFVWLVLSATLTTHASLLTTEKAPITNGSENETRLLKLDSSGMPVSMHENQWSCVEDTKTGLMWEKRDPTTALHGHDKYSWYQPEQSNSGPPRANPEFDLIDSTCFGFNPNDPSSFCNTSAYAERVNLSNYCGYSDWRLPTATELLTLVDPVRKQKNITPLLDTRFFPFHDPFIYWTSTVDNNGVVVTIFADDRVFKNSERTDTISIRLVRGTSY